MERQRRRIRRRRSRLRTAGRPALVLLVATTLAAGVEVGPAMARSAKAWASASIAHGAATLARAHPLAASATSPGVDASATMAGAPVESAPSLREPSLPGPSPASTSPSPHPPPVPAASATTGTAVVARTGTYRVVGLGDSVPSGSECRCTNYVTLVTRTMAAREGEVALVHNEAQGGFTTAGVLAQLTQSRIRAEIADSDLVVITIGANDFDTDALTSASCQPNPSTTCYARALAGQATQLASILTQVRALQATHGGRTLVTGYWNVFLDGDVAAARGAQYVRASNELTLAENAQIAALSRHAEARYVDIYGPFKALGNDTRLLAADGDHPNAAGHSLIATTLADALP